ncbi:MAG: MltA domain-containing protein [Desulfopila sp.]
MAGLLVRLALLAVPMAWASDDTATFLSDPAPSFTFIDDGERQSLLAALANQRTYLAGLPKTYAISVNGSRSSREELLDSIDTFIALLNRQLNWRQLSEQLRQRFVIVAAKGRDGQGTMLVTGYYEPLLAGSLVSAPPYIHPLYRRPKTLVSRRDPVTGKAAVGRLTDRGQLRPFWSRAEIDGPGQPLAGDELVYLRDPFEAFLLHVQGSGRIVLPDATVKTVRFAGHNGHSYRSIGTLLVKEGKMTLAESSVPAIRRYLHEHPEDLRRVINANPRYIFFAWGGDEPIRGSQGSPLTAGRSVAIDRKVLPDGLFGWLETTMPIVNAQGRVIGHTLRRRFVVPQDSGAAIRGPGRVDLFLGSTADAAATAGSMKEKGKLFLFLKKKGSDH